MMGGKFSDNPDPPCVHCGEDEKELVYLREHSAKLELANHELKVKVAMLERWVDDLQAGCYINCVYCGHRYGPDSEVPASMADVLKEHIEVCPEHPMSKLKAELATVKAEAKVLMQAGIDASKEIDRLRARLSAEGIDPDDGR